MEDTLIHFGSELKVIGETDNALTRVRQMIKNGLRNILVAQDACFDANGSNTKPRQVGVSPVVSLFGVEMPVNLKGNIPVSEKEVNEVRPGGQLVNKRDAESFKDSFHLICNFVLPTVFYHAVLRAVLSPAHLVAVHKCSFAAHRTVELKLVPHVYATALDGAEHAGLAGALGNWGAANKAGNCNLVALGDSKALAGTVAAILGMLRSIRERVAAYFAGFCNPFAVGVLLTDRRAKAGFIGAIGAAFVRCGAVVAGECGVHRGLLSSVKCLSVGLWGTQLRMRLSAGNYSAQALHLL